jgi:hypothetical protein
MGDVVSMSVNSYRVELVLYFESCWHLPDADCGVSSAEVDAGAVAATAAAADDDDEARPRSSFCAKDIHCALQTLISLL